MSYVRFVLSRTYTGRRQRLGLLVGSGQRIPGRRIPCGRHGEAREILDWMNRTLPFPPKPAFGDGRGYSWFLDGAREYLDRMRDLARLFERLGAGVWEIHSRNPGLITYRDDVQIVAIPDAERLRSG